jgi:hypothetical protein
MPVLRPDVEREPGVAVRELEIADVLIEASLVRSGPHYDGATDARSSGTGAAAIEAASRSHGGSGAGRRSSTCAWYAC